MPHEKFAITLTVRSGNTQGQMNNILNSLKNYLIPRSFEGSTAIDYVVLGFGGTPVTFPSPKDGSPHEVEVYGIFGVRDDTPNNVEGRIDTLLTNYNFLARQRFSTDKTLAYMQQFLLDKARNEQGCTRYWQLIPTDDVTTGVVSAATLVNKFTVFS